MANEQKDPTYFVAIGGSAGGLEAFEEFFKNMPSDSGMAFIVVQHLDPTHKGMLPELLGQGDLRQPAFLQEVPHS